MSYRLWTCGKMIYGQKGDNSLDMRALEKMRALRRLLNKENNPARREVG